MHPPRTPLLMTVALVGLLSACNAAARPTLAPVQATAPPTAATGPTDFSTTTFAVPFSITLPAGWKVGIEQSDMLFVGLDGGPQVIGTDVQIVSAAVADPCDDASGAAAIGPSAADLANWMLAWAPLKATAAAPVTIGGQQALVVEEAFAGAPCPTANIWRTDGGYLDPTEHKRYFIFETGGKRFVATIVSQDANFAAHVDEGLAVLESLAFKP